MAQHSPDDIGKLITGVERKVAADEAVRRRLSSAASARPGGFRVVAAIAAIAAGLVVSWQVLSPPAAGAVVRDLEQVISMAREAIEAERNRSGLLPAVLPNASLAAVVQYERRASEYRLAAAIGGVRVVLEWDGSRKVETGEAR